MIEEPDPSEKLLQLKQSRMKGMALLMVNRLEILIQINRAGPPNP